MFRFKISHIFLVLITTVFLLFFDTSSVLSYIYTLILFSVLNKVITLGEKNPNFTFLHFYLHVAIIIFLFQKFTIPDYLGLSGPGGSVGTDDVRYYAWLLDGKVPYSINLYGNVHPFANLLKILYPFKIYNPLNIVIFNVLGVSFLPYYVYKLAQTITDNDKISNLAQILMLLCPYSMAMGLIIMRDMFITTLVIAGLYYFINKKYFVLILIIPLIIYIRMGSLIFLLIGIFIFSLDFIKNKIKNRLSYFSVLIFVLISLFGVSYFIIPNIDSISNGKLSSGLFRAEFFDKLSVMDENAAILKLMTLPLILRTVTLTLFFYFLPFLNFNIFPLGVLNIRSLLISLSPIYMLFLWTPIFKTILNSIYEKRINNKITSLIWVSILFALSLGTISLQARHKTVLFPILYILAAYGWYLPSKKYNKISRIFTFLVFLLQIVFLIT